MTLPTAPVPRSRTSPFDRPRVTPAPPSADGLQPDQSDVILVGESGAVAGHRLGHDADDVLGAARALLRDQGAEPLLAELLVVGAARFADPVAVAQENVAGPHLDRVRLVGGLEEQSQRRTALAERLDPAAPAAHDAGRTLAGVDLGHRVGPRVEETVEESDE